MVGTDGAFPDLDLGTYLGRGGQRLLVDTRDALYHTAILAQSGAGKSSLVARFIEELVVSTHARVVVLDAGGDLRRCSALRKRAEPGKDATDKKKQEYREFRQFGEHWQGVGRTHVVGPAAAPRWQAPGHSHSLSIEFSRLPLDLKREVLKLNWPADATECEALRAADQLWREGSAEIAATPSELVDVNAWKVLTGPMGGSWPDRSQAYTRLGVEMQRINKWGIWLEPGQTSGWDLRAPDAMREQLTIVDLPSMGARECRLFVVSMVLQVLFDRAKDEWEEAQAQRPKGKVRLPTLVVLDEAHHWAPAEGGDAQVRALRSCLLEIAAEGRKYGLWLIVATQRPSKVAPGLLSECENACLLRLQSPVEHTAAADTWGVPLETIQRTAHFEPGQGLLLGRWVAAPVAFHAARPRTAQAGGNLRDEWRRPRQRP